MYRRPIQTRPRKLTGRRWDRVHAHATAISNCARHLRSSGTEQLRRVSESLMQRSDLRASAIGTPKACALMRILEPKADGLAPRLLTV